VGELLDEDRALPQTCIRCAVCAAGGKCRTKSWSHGESSVCTCCPWRVYRTAPIGI
jgi:hypothetical protein